MVQPLKLQLHRYINITKCATRTIMLLKFNFVSFRTNTRKGMNWSLLVKDYT